MSNTERQAGLHGLEAGGPSAAIPAELLDPAMARAKKEFRIAEIRMEIAKLNYEKSQLRADLVAK